VTAQAKHLYTLALRSYVELYGTDHPLVARALISLSGCTELLPFASADEMGAALDLLSDAVAIEKRIYGEGDPRTATSLRRMGCLLARLRRLDEAREALFEFERVVERHQTAQTWGDFSFGLESLAEVLSNQGDPTRSEAYLVTTPTPLAADASAQMHVNVGQRGDGPRRPHIRRAGGTPKSSFSSTSGGGGLVARRSLRARHFVKMLVAGLHDGRDVPRTVPHPLQQRPQPLLLARVPRLF
jgi:hypothetical protein